MRNVPTEKDSARAQGKVTIQRALEAFEQHHLIRGTKDSDRWVLARKYEDGKIRSDMLTEVVSLWGGRLFVGGDIDDCSFAYYSGPSDRFHLRKLAWMGRCQDILYYVAQKAQIGLTDGGALVWTWDNDVARYDLWTMLTDEHAHWSDEEREGIEDAMRYVDDGEYRVLDKLCECLEDPAGALPGSNFGKRLSSRVIYAWAAVHRLCEILLGPNPADPRGDLAP
jgi:hypothetical protein